MESRLTRRWSVCPTDRGRKGETEWRIVRIGSSVDFDVPPPPGHRMEERSRCTTTDICAAKTVRRRRKTFRSSL